MRIAVNALSAVAGGGVTYLNQLFRHLSEIDKKNEYLVITTKKGEKVLQANYKYFRILTFEIPSLSVITRLLWEQLYLWYILKKYKADVLYSPANIGLVFFTFPTVLMIQTVAPFDPCMIKKQNVYYRVKFNLLKILTSLSIKKARRVIFITDNARKQLSLYYNIKEENAAFVYHGKSRLFKPNLDDDRLKEIKKKYNLDKFILYVSNIYKYKNYFELVFAFSLIKNKINSNLKLVLVGESFDKQYTEFLRTFILKNKLEDRILLLGHIPFEDLPFFYVLCSLFVYPSTCESFGMTLVEAMACGAPILASNIEPMLEICKNAAVYFNPYNPQDIAEKIETVLSDEDLLQKLRQNALRRADCFNWKDNAEKTLHVLQECFENY